MERTFKNKRKSSFQKPKPFFNQAKGDSFFSPEKKENFFSQNQIQPKSKSTLNPQLHQQTQNSVQANQESTEEIAQEQTKKEVGANSLSIQRMALPNDQEERVESTSTQNSGQFIVSDMTSPGSGQMQKTRFLDQLNSEVCSATDEALAGSTFSSDSCPYIRRAFARHRNSSPAQIEAVLNRYEPRALQAGSANEIISIIRVRTGQAVAHWRSTGELTGIPPEIASQIPSSLRTMAQVGSFLENLGTGIISGLSSIGSSIASGISNVTSGIGSVASGIASGVSSIASSIGGLFFKGNSGGATLNQSPESVQTSLGTGYSLDGQTRSRMESAFGSNFGDVQLHTDSNAASLSEGMNAKAFTVGKHVAFGSGEYQPGSIEGDALIAHELAHVEQQRGATQVQQKGSNDHGDLLEREADQSAIGAVANMYGLSGEGARTKLSSSGFQLRRCSRSSSQQTSTTQRASGGWTVSELKEMLDSCDGGLGIWARAKAANGGTDPAIIFGSGGSVDTTTGVITLNQSDNKCIAVQVLIQELSNLSRKNDLNAAFASASAGDLSRIDFIRRIELLEYETGVVNVITAFDACKTVWPCPTCEKEWARSAANFDDYFNNFLSTSHKENYGTWWDSNCRAAYEAKHS